MTTDIKTFAKGERISNKFLVAAIHGDAQTGPASILQVLDNAGNVRQYVSPNELAKLFTEAMELTGANNAQGGIDTSLHETSIITLKYIA